MRLPRRVPWPTLAELDQVCSWIYTDETDSAARLKAINRLSAWKATTQLPHALEAVLSILSSINLDDSYLTGATTEVQRQQNFSDGHISFPSAKYNAAMNVRQSYATAIVRLVNGLVDPLQLGPYARSIATIAAQIGLPQWLVELRHAATHEDLPSLELLRAGAKESLQWLLHNYFLPTLSTSSIDQSIPEIHLSPVKPLLKQYKSIMKTISRDTSLRIQYKDELSRCLRDVERWIGEAKVASVSLDFNGWGTRGPSDEGEESERWALERLCDYLLDRGSLVPVSTRKRLASNLKSDPVLPSGLVAIWSPLLSTLKTNHPSLPWVLVSAITNLLLFKPSKDNDNASNSEQSYEYCLAAWAAYCVDHWEPSSSDAREEGGMVLQRKDIVVHLVSALAIRADEFTGTRRGANALLRLLVQSHPTLEDMSRSLLSAIAQRTAPSGDAWTDGALQVMEERLNNLLSSDSPLTTGGTYNSTSKMDVEQTILVPDSIDSESQLDEMPRGWKRVPADTWKPCPIGVFRE